MFYLSLRNLIIGYSLERRINMIVKKSEREIHENASTCIVYEHNHGDNNIDIAEAEIRGRYPEKGYSVNEQCKELFLVSEGSGKIETDGEIFELNKGDSVLIQPKQKYFFEGNLDLVITCRPAWNPDQYKVIE